MAARTFESLIDLPNLTSAPSPDSSRSLSSLDDAAASEINLGAFRGIAWALVIETTFVVLAAVAWGILRALLR